VELRTAECVRAGYADAIAAGLGQKDTAAIILDLEKRAGLEPLEA
jgi:hypothetical protein